MVLDFGPPCKCKDAIILTRTEKTISTLEAAKTALIFGLAAAAGTAYFEKKESGCQTYDVSLNFQIKAMV